MPHPLSGGEVHFSESKDVTVNGKKIDPSMTRPWPYESLEVRWYKVEPEKSSYNNWRIGYFEWEPLTYKETLFKEGKDWSVEADADPSDKVDNPNKGLGTMRYKAEVTYNDKKLSTPGKESIDYQGMTNKVHRVSFRKDDTFTGWLFSFFNLPYIFGSSRRQAEEYVGVDCADLVICAYKKTGAKVDYTNVQGLKKYTDLIFQEKNMHYRYGTFCYKDKPLLFGQDVKEGDLLVFDGSHVGVLYKDRSDPEGDLKGAPDGILNEYDTFIHVLSDNPSEDRLDYCVSFSVLRWKKQK